MIRIYKHEKGIKFGLKRGDVAIFTCYDAIYQLMDKSERFERLFEDRETYWRLWYDYEQDRIIYISTV